MKNGDQSLNENVVHFENSAGFKKIKFSFLQAWDTYFESLKSRPKVMLI